MTNLKINAKKIAMLVGLSTSLVLMNGCSKKEESKVTEVVNKIKDETCLDENMSFEKLEIIDQLQEYIQLSTIIHKLNLDEIAIDMEEYSLLSPYEIKKLISCYTNKNNSKYLSIQEQEKVTKELIAEEKLINKYLYDSGYELEENFLLAILKSEVLDAKELDENSYNKVTILSEEKSHVNDRLDFFLIKFNLTKDIKTRDDDIKEALISLYKMQNKGEPNHEDHEQVEYNKNRNEMLQEAFENGIKVIENQYTMKKNVMKKVKK